MYLDIFDDLRLNKRLIKLTNFEVAAYWAELQSILKQVVKKQTMDEKGFFTLDRDFMERETTLNLSKQLKCDEKLISLGVAIKDPDNPNRLAISVENMIEIITDEDTKKLRKSSKTTKADEKAAKVAGIKATLKKAIIEDDIELRAAFERWVDGMVDAQNCRFTKAVVQVFEKTVTEYTNDKAMKLKIIDIATTNSYRDVTWAINRLSSTRPQAVNVATKLPEQKICTGISDNIIF